MAYNASTTIRQYTTTVFIEDGDPDDDTTEYPDTYNRNYQLAEFAVPMTVTVFVVISVCMVIGYTKAKRRRQRAQQMSAEAALRTGSGTNRTSYLPNVSSGAPMTPAAYQHIYQQQQNQQQMLQGGNNFNPPPYTVLSIPYDQPPPSYEDTMKIEGGMSNAAFQSSTQNLIENSNSPHASSDLTLSNTLPNVQQSASNVPYARSDSSLPTTAMPATITSVSSTDPTNSATNSMEVSNNASNSANAANSSVPLTNTSNTGAYSEETVNSATNSDIPSANSVGQTNRISNSSVASTSVNRNSTSIASSSANTLSHTLSVDESSNSHSVET